jgi:hypothetical protein
MSNLFDPIDGEPLRDFLGQLQNANARSAQQRSQQATNSKLDQIAFLLAQQQAEQARQLALPPCPYCYGKLEGTPELCRHCRSNLSWVEGYPCKPGTERELKKKIDETRRLIDETQRRLEEEETKAKEEEAKAEKAKEEVSIDAAVATSILMVLFIFVVIGLAMTLVRG